jgi:hypothetical protein
MLSTVEQEALKHDLLGIIARDEERRRLVGQRPITIEIIREVQAKRGHSRLQVPEYQSFEVVYYEAPKQTTVEEVLKMPPEEITLPPSEMIQRPDGKWQRVNKQTIEERMFQVALIYMESYFTQQPPTGLKTATKSREVMKKIMEKTLNSSQVRYVAAGQCSTTCFTR